MKKYLLLLLTLVFAMTSYADKVTEQQARQKAQRFFKDKQIVSKSLTRSMTRSAQPSSIEDFYVFNAENNGGFVIISGDDRTPEVLGYSDTGSLDLNNLPPNLKWWMEEYSKQIKALDTSAQTQRVNNSRAITRTTKTPVEPLITTKWGQGSPYNLMCPEIDDKHCVTGCVATAMAQVMYYHKWPQEPCAAIPEYTAYTRQIEMPALPPTTFKWSAMRDRYWDGEQGESADAVAELMRYCGQAVEMNYNIDESGAFEMPRHLIQYFGYSKNAKYVTMSQYTESQWEDILYKELSEGRPMLYGGANLTSAHDFICDGYDGDGYFHFNWGWNGDANGYYQLSILYRTMYCGYVNAQTAIIGLEPEKGEMARPYVYGYNGGELTQTNYSRSSTSDNFTNITLNGGIYIQYEVDVTQDVIIDYGLGLYRGDQLLSVLNQSTATLNIDKPAVANEMSFSFGGDLGDGTYQIRHIYKYPNSEIWQTCYDAYLNYIVATISGTTMTLRNVISPDMQEADYIVNDVSFDPGIFNDNITMVTVNLTNTGDTNQELIYFWVRSGENSQGYDLICGFIPPGETGNVVFPIDLHEKGEITMCISSKINRENVRWEKVITMPEYQECKLSCTDYSIKNFNNGILKDSKLQVTLTIKNTGDKNFNGPISYILAEYIGDTRVFTNVVRQLQTVTLNKGESTTFDAVIPHLENNTWYQLTLFCGAAGGEVIYFPDCFNLEFFATIHSCSYEGLNYVYGPGAKTANVIAGDYQQLNSVSIPSSISVDGQSYKVTEIAPKAFNNCHFQSVILPEGLECIRSYAFQGCEIKSINYPSSLKHISDYAFYCSSEIKEIALPEGLVSIGPSAFRECRDLEILKFPSTLRSIDYGVISNCNNLKSVYSAMADPIKIAENTFEYIDFSGNTPKQVPPPATITLYVPKGSVSKYQEAAGWNAFARITDKLPYKLTYYVDGEIYKEYIIDEETSITPESEPTKETYQFSGWSEIPETMPNHDVIVTGTFVRHFDVGHVVNVVNYIMSANATAEQVTLYDLNSDNELNIGDIILIVKSILNNGNGGSNPAQTRSDNNVDLSQYTAAQFVLNVDKGVAIKNIQLVSDMANSHQMMYSKLGDNTYYVVVYSLSNQLMKPEKNIIVKVETDDGGLTSFTMNDLIVATINGETESYKGSLSTGIHQVDSEGKPAAIYDLKGHRLDGAKSKKKGLYIINGKKVVVK